MTLKRELLAIFIALLFLIVSILYILFLIIENQGEIAQAEIRRFESYRLASELRQSSDDLTRMVRTYIVTGDPRFKQYFKQIQNIRDGELPRPLNYGNIYWDFISATGTKPRKDTNPIAVITLMRRVGITENEFQLLATAKYRSDKLIQLEERAMNALVGLYPNAQGEYVIHGKPDRELALQLTHGETYHEAKASIMQPIAEFFDSIDQRTAAEVSHLKNKGSRLTTLALSLAMVAILLLFISVLIIQRQSFARQVESAELEKIPELEKLKINTRLIIWKGWPLIISAIVATVIILSVAWWTQKEIEDQIRIRTGETLEIVLGTTTSAIEEWFDNLSKEVSVWSSQSVLRESLTQYFSSTQADEQKNIENQLKTILEPILSYPQISGYLLFTMDGKVIQSNFPNYLNQYLNHDEMRQLMDRIETTPHHSSILLPQFQTEKAKENIFSYFWFASGVMDQNKKLVGVLAILVKPEAGFTEILQRGRIGNTGESYAFNKKGQLLSLSRFNYQLQDLGLIKPDESPILRLEIRQPKEIKLDDQSVLSQQGQPFTLMANSAIRGESGIDLNGYKDYRGIPVVGAWQWLENIGIGITSEIDTKEAYAVLNDYTKQAKTAVALAILMIGALTLAFFWSRIVMAKAKAKLDLAYGIMKIHSQRMEKELNIGREIQMSMLPLVFPAFPASPEFAVYSILIPAREVGGDFYDFYFIDNKHLCLCIADVSGKGVPAALFMAVTKTLMKSKAATGKMPDEILTIVNKEICSENTAYMFVTTFFAILNIETGDFYYTNAGHNPPLLKSDSNVTSLRIVHGPPLGVAADRKYQQAHLQLKRGDFILLYTDGVTEAINSKEELYSENRLYQLIQQRKFESVVDIAETVISDVRQFANGIEQSDDITLVALQFFCISPYVIEYKLSLQIKNDLAEIASVIQSFDKFANQYGLPKKIIQKASIGLDEIINNIISYGFEDKKEHLIEIYIELKKDQLIVNIEDDGKAFNPFSYKIPDIKSTLEVREAGGLGIHIVRNLFEKVGYQRKEGKNILTMIKYFDL